MCRSISSASWWSVPPACDARADFPSVSWNLGVPALADRVIRDELADIILLGRPALANPHWPVYAARELGHADPFSLVPEDWAWWIRTRPGPEGSLGWPLPSRGAQAPNRD